MHQLLGSRKFEYASEKTRCLSEAVVRRYSVEKVFLEILQNSQENNRARVSFFNKIAVLRTPPVADSGHSKLLVYIYKYNTFIAGWLLKVYETIGSKNV